MPTLFDFVKNIAYEKTDLRKHPDFEKNYNPFMINRVLSMNPKTASIACFMSKFTKLPKSIHYLFYLYFLDKENLWFEYKKRECDIEKDTLDAIMEYFQINLIKAKDIIHTLGEEKVNIIIESFKK